ncbi:error-prone DNA polymerase [Pedomonas sp. V897]|uniref:error-prone DNA polymerase n=1 Tax=Pedomonas sp. V897 TaxID=3446482 RepID=UPI003EE3C7AA
MSRYAELQVTTNFSFLQGASHAAELVERAQALGLEALAVTDRNTLAGAVRMHTEARARGGRLVIGCRLDLADAPSLLAYPTDRAAYGRLSRLLTLGKCRAPKGECFLTLADVAAHAEGLILAILPPERRDRTTIADFIKQLLQMKQILHPAAGLYLVAQHLYRGDDRRWLGRLQAIGDGLGLPLVATNDVLYHMPERRPLQDVLTCIREKTTISAAGLRLAGNAERHLKPPEIMAELFRGHEEALANTLRIVEACRFSLDELRYEYPDEPVPPGVTPQQHLEALVWEGAARRFPGGLPDTVRTTIQRELALIAQRDYAPYFLTVHDIVSYARAQGILCQGRGSAANSVVCFCLGITSVNPTEVNLLFERFISEERHEPPDIDVDFEHERREEVIQYIYRRYGRHRAGLAATVISYRPRSAIRDVGKAMGLTEDVTSALAGTIWGSGAGDGGEIDEKRLREAGLQVLDTRVMQALQLANQLIGFPRHLSQHVGGFVLTRGALDETVPIGNAAMAERTFIEWDKDDINALGLLKVDVLALGMLTALHKAFDLVKAHHGRPLALETIPREDPRVYDMLCRADSVGVFQVESRAQMNMLPRLKPRCFYDLVIQVAIVRPGPIQGDMVHPYLRRRDGLEPVFYPSPAPGQGPPDELERILKKTLGVPLFQEQAMRIAMEAAQFSPAEANGLRRAMATFRRRGIIHEYEEMMVSRMIARGYDPVFARRCFDQIKGFGEYGFPESHAASFALLVYASAWLKCHYPDVFCAALLNSQPLGFYAPAQIVRDAREHGVEVREPDVNHSHWDCTLEAAGEGRFAVRLGLRMIDGLGQSAVEVLVAARRDGPFRTVEEVRRRSGLPVDMLEKMAAADAFRSLGHDRRQAHWAVRAVPKARPLPLFEHVGEVVPEPAVSLPDMALSEEVVADYQSLRLSLKAHPMALLRPRYARQGVSTCAGLQTLRDGARASMAGVVLVRQRPGSASGVVFMTVEDETGIANIVFWPGVFEKYRAAVMGGRLVRIEGRIQRLEATPDGPKPAVPVVHLVAVRIIDMSGDLALLSDGLAASADPADRAADSRMRPGQARHPRQVRVIPRSRDFH